MKPEIKTTEAFVRPFFDDNEELYEYLEDHLAKNS